MKYMNKILRYAALTLSAVSMLASCEKDGEVLTVKPTKAPEFKVNQEVVQLEEAKADEEALHLSWTKADFSNSEVSLTYDLQLSTDGENTLNLDLGTGSEYKFTQKFLNAKCRDLDLQAGVESEVSLQLIAVLITSEGKKYEANKLNSIKSNIIKIKVIPYENTKPIPDIEKMGVGIIGSAVGGWNPENDVMLDPVKDTPHLWKRENVALLGGKKFKFRKDHDWNKGGNWGKAKTADATDFPEGTAFNDGGSGDFTVSDAQGGKYTVTFNDETLEFKFVRTGDLENQPEPEPELKKGVSLIGSAVGGWEPANDIMLTKDVSNEHLWTAKRVEIKVGQLKFRFDQAWSKNWGKGADAFPQGTAQENSQENFKIEAAQAGIYDVTFNDETLAFEFTKSQAPKTGIGIVGDGANGWPSDDNDLDKDVMLTQDASNEHLWKGEITLKKGEIKFRKDQAWAVNWGAKDFPEGTGTSGGANIEISEAQAGEYTVTFNDQSGEYVFTPKGGIPAPTYEISIIGSAVQGWGTDVMLKPSTTVAHEWTGEVTLTATSGSVKQFKFRKNRDWSNPGNWGGASSTFPNGTAVDQDATGIKVPEGMSGTYIVKFNDETAVYSFTKKP